MALTRIEYGALASSDVMNNNFEYLENRISDVSAAIDSNSAGIYSNIATINNTISAQVNKLRPIGQPIIRLDNTIFDDEIRLEGGEVSRTTYADLFAIYGITYGEGDGVTTFILPDFRNKVLWGGTEFGYLEATLPNIRGNYSDVVTYNSPSGSGAFSSGTASTWKKSGTDQTLRRANMVFNANASSSVYKDGAAVRPASVIIRVVTRYK